MRMECWNRAAYIYMERQQIETSITYLSKSVSINESQTDTWANLSVLFQSKKENDQAFISIKKALETNPKL